MAEFEQAFEFMGPHEWRYNDPNGGYTNDPDDPGGETKFGISKRANPDLDIASLTLDQAKERYKARYWNGYWQINSQPVASKIFDCAVNMGNSHANRLLQLACGDCGLPTTADGIWGPNTVAAANTCNPDTLLDYIRHRMLERYLQICDADPNQNKFLKGWTARAKE